MRKHAIIGMIVLAFCLQGPLVRTDLGLTPNRFSALAADVVIFTASWCRYCDMAKEFLSKKDVRYLEIDIERSEKGRRVYEKLGGRGLPLIVIDNSIIKGFDRTAIKAALAN